MFILESKSIRCKEMKEKRLSVYLKWIIYKKSIFLNIHFLYVRVIHQMASNVQ